MSSSRTSALTPFAWLKKNFNLGPEPTQLCGTCLLFGRQIEHLWRTKESQHIGTLKQIEEKTRGCALCKLIWDAISADNRERYKDLTLSVSLNGGTSVAAVYIQALTTQSLSGGYTAAQLDVCAEEGSAPAIEGLIHRRCVKPASDLSFAKARLAHCIANHDHGAALPVSHPYRLIAVGTIDGSEPVRLVQGSLVRKTYAALSHCWGTRGTLSTAKATLRQFSREIPWAQLPKTFREAIEVARGLDIPFIWIDSLCIVQDDPLDWEAESTKMADIYNGALLTIMAASARNCHEGCFQYKPLTENKVALPYVDKNGAMSSSIFVSDYGLLEGYDKVVKKGPLFKRAWVFQERIMSKRKLIFSKEQTYWECDTSVHPESNSDVGVKFSEYSDLRNQRFQIFANPNFKFETENGCVKYDPSWNELWTDLVASYSFGSLTYATDRLPSLSGLARTFAHHAGYTYIAGMWLEHLAESLSWSADLFAAMLAQDSSSLASLISKIRAAPSSDKHLEEAYIAPSWSWASVKSPCQFHRCHRDVGIEIEITGFDVQLSGKDPYGKIAPGAALFAKGRLVTAALVGVKRANERENSADDDFFEYDMAELKTPSGSIQGYINLDRPRTDLPMEVACLELYSGYTHQYDPSEPLRVNDNAYCLILKYMGYDMVFRRVAFGMLSHVAVPEDYIFFGGYKQNLVLI